MVRDHKYNPNSSTYKDPDSTNETTVEDIDFKELQSLGIITVELWHSKLDAGYRSKTKRTLAGIKKKTYDSIPEKALKGSAIDQVVQLVCQAS